MKFFGGVLPNEQFMFVWVPLTSEKNEILRRGATERTANVRSGTAE